MVEGGRGMEGEWEETERTKLEKARRSDEAAVAVHLSEEVGV